MRCVECVLSSLHGRGLLYALVGHDGGIVIMLEANLNCLLRVLYLGTESLSAYLTFDSHPLTQETIMW